MGICYCSNRARKQRNRREVSQPKCTADLIVRKEGLLGEFKYYERMEKS